MEKIEAKTLDATTSSLPTIGKTEGARNTQRSRKKVRDKLVVYFMRTGILFTLTCFRSFRSSLTLFHPISQD